MWTLKLDFSGMHVEAPFLNHRVKSLETCSPSEEKIWGKPTKHILKAVSTQPSMFTIEQCFFGRRFITRNCSQNW
jgi:hypothetical protein